MPYTPKTLLKTMYAAEAANMKARTKAGNFSDATLVKAMACSGMTFLADLIAKDSKCTIEDCRLNFIASTHEDKNVWAATILCSQFDSLYDAFVDTMLDVLHGDMCAIVMRHAGKKITGPRREKIRQQHASERSISGRHASLNIDKAIEEGDNARP
jgi:hypothetical protein